MSLIRATLLLCMTALISVATVTYSQYKVDRFQVIPYKEGVFIFDRQSTATNYCNDTKCVVISSEFVMPKQILVAEIPGVVVEQKTVPATASTVTVPQQRNVPAPQTSANNPVQSQADLVTPNFQDSTMNAPSYGMAGNEDMGNQGMYNQNQNDVDGNFGN